MARKIFPGFYFTAIDGDKTIPSVKGANVVVPFDVIKVYEEYIIVPIYYGVPNYDVVHVSDDYGDEDVKHYKRVCELAIAIIDREKIASVKCEDASIANIIANVLIERGYIVKVADKHDASLTLYDIVDELLLDGKVSTDEPTAPALDDIIADIEAVISALNSM